MHFWLRENTEMILTAKKALLPFAGQPNKKELLIIAITIIVIITTAITIIVIIIAITIIVTINRDVVVRLVMFVKETNLK